MNRKGVILAGGRGTRLSPLTAAVSKQLLPIYDKPMIYYPLSVLMAAGLREIAVITTPEDHAQFQRLLGDGSAWGMRIEYRIQASPDGLAQAMILAEDFLDGAPSALILGDNLFHGSGLDGMLSRAAARDEATIFAYPVADPRRYGVVVLDAEGRPVDIQEKPAEPRSNLAVTGLYFYDGRAPALARSLTPSPRGELEITDLNRLYMEAGQLTVEPFDRGFTWLDTGTHESLLEAGELVRAIELRQGFRIGVVEEIAFRQGWIDACALHRLADVIPNAYGDYLRTVADWG